MATGPVPHEMTSLNGYLVPINTLVPGGLGTEVLDLRADGHPKLIRVLYRQDRSVIPPRLRLLVVPHPEWQTWSVHSAGQVDWHTADAAPAPFTHPTATLKEIYEGVLKHWGRDVSEATRTQIELLAPNHILDLPLDGDTAFFDDYSWITTPVRSAPYSIEDAGDEDDSSTRSDGKIDHVNEVDSDIQGLLWEHNYKTPGSGSDETVAGKSDGCDGDITMAPSGPKAQQNAAATNSSTPTPASEPAAPKGPHPGHIQVACQYTSEQRLRRMLRDNKSDPAREDNYRLQGVQLIDNVRNMLRVYVWSFLSWISRLMLFSRTYADIISAAPSRPSTPPVSTITGSDSRSAMPSTTTRMPPWLLSSSLARWRTPSRSLRRSCVLRTTLRIPTTPQPRTTRCVDQLAGCADQEYN